MGVRGLTTYVNYNQHLFLKEHLLHNTNLVIDGHSLCAQLYRNSNTFSAFGGDYDRYAAYVKNFFKSLKKCNISCYVLFDGCCETRKLKTAYSRLRSKIKGASRLDAVTQTSLQMFPLLLRDVFKQVLSELKIPYTVCEFEADDEIAAMARHLDCPVLSYDSDFFIYNVLYIPFNTVESKPTACEENGNKFYAMSCKLYMVRHLVDNLGGLKEDMLPLLATLLGNDYVQKRAFKNFFSQLKLPKGKSKNEQQRSIHGLLKWLQNETLDTAIAKIVGRIKKTEKKRVLYTIIKSMDGYTRKHCKSLKYFNLSNDKTSDEPTPKNLKDFSEINTCSDDDNDSSEEEEDNDSSSESSDSSSDDISEHETLEELKTELPEWFSERIRQNIIPQLYVDCYTLHLHFLAPQAEDYKYEDASLCTLSFLRYAFDILTDFSEDNLMFVSRDNNCHYKKILLGTDYSIARPIEKSYSELTVKQLSVYFEHFIKEKFASLDLSLLDSLPPNFRLAMLSILWWVANCSVPKGFVHSLFTSYVMLDVVDEKTGTFRGHKHFNTKFAKKLQELRQRPSDITEDSNLLLNKNKVSYEDSLITASVLLQHFNLSVEIQKRPKSYDVKRMHKFAQFQCCLQQYNCLNCLSGNPYPATMYSKFYNGTFVYNIAGALDRQSDPVSFLEQYLKGAHTVLLFYKSLCRVYEQCAEQLGLATSNSMFVGKRRRKNKKADKDISFLADCFESEVII